MRLATWNVNSLTARMPRVTQWIEENEPDVLCLQETKQADAKFPTEEFAALGYESAHHGDGRWNGVALLSRVGLADAVRGFGTPHDDNGCRIIAATCGGVRVHSVYVPNGRSLDNENYGFKLEWLAQLRTMLDKTCRVGDSVAVCGDFNVAPDDGDVWDPAHFVEATHVSEPERAALRHIEAWGLTSARTWRRGRRVPVWTVMPARGRSPRTTLPSSSTSPRRRKPPNASHSQAGSQ
jgi:exodeoxyribonuclease-3